MFKNARETARGGCPRCGTTIPFGKTMLFRGRPFRCAGCGNELVVSRTGASLAVAVFSLLVYLSDRLPIAIVVVMLIGGVLIEWPLTTVRIVDEPVSGT